LIIKKLYIANKIMKTRLSDAARIKILVPADTRFLNFLSINAISPLYRQF